MGQEDPIPALMPNAGVQAGARIRGRALKTRTTGRLAIQCRPETAFNYQSQARFDPVGSNRTSTCH